MAADHVILSIDQGTTSSRALVFGKTGEQLAVAQREFRQIYPEDGWVEHDAAEIWRDTVEVCREALKKAGSPSIAGIGITNQRETIVLWERASGKPLHHAIVWQDRRTAGLCETLRAEGKEAVVQEKTGLLLDPYFSGTKLAWLLDNVEGARERAAKGELAAGTIDSWLIWNLTGGKAHVTDATNASRTLLFNIRTQDWDDEILGWFDIPRALLPEVKDCCARFGVAGKEVLGAEVPILGVAGDQQAAFIGQACFEPGMMKSTYGTGCFALVNTGTEFVASQNRLLTTVGYRLGGETHYALEGSIFMAGATIQWLRDEMKLIKSAADSEKLAAEADPDGHVILVPAFTGLGAPYWDPHARGAILGMTRDTHAADIVRAGVESVSFQTRDLMEAMGADMKGAGLSRPNALRVDGGMAANNWFLQNLTDMIGCPVERPEVIETTALGAAYLAGLEAGLFQSPADISAKWRCDRHFDPALPGADADRRYGRWKEAVGRILSR